MNRAPLDYDAADDGAKSYLAAIEAKRIRGDDYYLRQPDDPGVEEDLEPAARPFNWRLIIGLFALQLAVIGAFVWVLA
jgi:hypothetical protein